MSIYPNYQNKNYYDYVKYVKQNDFYFDKIKYAKPEVDDKCPETMIYSKKSGTLHKYFNYIDYLSLPKSTKFQLEHKNFLQNFASLNEKEKLMHENQMFDLKIKNTKSEYRVEKFDKEFGKAKEYKKIISTKNNLYFKTFSLEKKTKTDVNFFNEKKGNQESLPLLDSVNPKTKTTSDNFFKNEKISIISKTNDIKTLSKNVLNGKDSYSNFNIPKNINSSEDVRIDFSNINSVNKNMNYSKNVLSPVSNNNLNTVNIINDIIDEYKSEKLIPEEELVSEKSNQEKEENNNINEEENYDRPNEGQENIEQNENLENEKYEKDEKNQEKEPRIFTSKSLINSSNKQNDSFKMENNLEERNKSSQHLAKSRINFDSIEQNNNNIKVKKSEDLAATEKLNKLEELELNNDISKSFKKENSISNSNKEKEKEKEKEILDKDNVDENKLLKTEEIETINKITNSMIKPDNSSNNLSTSQKLYNNNQTSKNFFRQTTNNLQGNNTSNNNIVQLSSYPKKTNSQTGENVKEKIVENLGLFEGKDTSKIKTTNKNNSLLHNSKESFKKTKINKKKEETKNEEIFELKKEDEFKNNMKNVLFNTKAFMEKLNLVEVTVYMRNKMLFLEVNPISIMNDKVFILCIKNKQDRQIISKIFKNYQSFVNNLYYDYPKVQLKTKYHVDYVSNWFYKTEIEKLEAERNKIL